MITADNPTSYLDSNKMPHYNTSDRQSAPTLNTNNIQIQTITPPKVPYKSNPSKHINTNSITNFEKTKQIIMDIDALSHSPTLCNKILQEFNLNGLCQYSNLHKALIVHVLCYYATLTH